MTAPPLDIPPGPGFVATVTAATGIHRNGTKATAQLLITHPGPSRRNESLETVLDGMHRLATALHLGPGDQPAPSVGRQLMLSRGRVALDYGHDQYVMTVPQPSPDWLALVSAGAGCRLYLTLGPLSLGADRAETMQHLTDSLEHGQLMWGTTFLRRRLS
ncbi:hypothetical protein ACFY0P_36660 [Streptomyces sp. NPDC001714]|uniref:hypothetical protein n=1 Tax=Streptomyces sp. NPDC001714 TaxID=3364603 RepID=UPI00368E7352